MATLYYWIGFGVFWLWCGGLLFFGALSLISEYRERRALRKRLQERWN